MGFQVLSGLFGVDAKGVKVFYIPIKRKQVEEQAEEQPQEQPQEQPKEESSNNRRNNRSNNRQEQPE